MKSLSFFRLENILYNEKKICFGLYKGYSLIFIDNEILVLGSIGTLVDNLYGKIQDQKCKNCLKCENCKKCEECKNNGLEWCK